jgi:hypothetical protein
VHIAAAKDMDRLIKNLTLTLEEEEVEELGKPITGKDMVRALMDSPKGKSLGKDKLPYECYKEAPGGSSHTYGARQPHLRQRSQPVSWTQIIILVLLKEADSYSTHKFHLISLLNTDYKLVMKIGPTG